MPGGPIKTPQSQSCPRLCTKCQKIDFNYYLSHRIGKGYFGKNLGSRREVRRRYYCRFCRLVTECLDSLASPPSDSAPLELFNEKSYLLSSTHENYDGSRSQQYSNEFDLKDEARRTHSDHAFRFLVTWKGCKQAGQIQYLAHNDPSDRRQFFGRPVDPQVVNWRVIKSWLRTCDRYHHGTCDSPGLASDRLPTNLRVIDIDTWCIVNAPSYERFEYVALTYVWGEKEMGWLMPSTTKSQVRGGRGPGESVVELPEHLPQTIKDALTITRRIGYKYLWVDSLCIIQDDPREKHSQISHMDAIYNCAALTIAAASGRHADCGIPGVSVPRRYQQKSEVVKGLRLALCMPKYSQLDEGNALHWNTRGWTFQEKLLSRKLLLFTDYQVYFRCSNAIWTEDVEMEYGRLSNSMRRRPTPFRWAPERQKRELKSWHHLLDIATLGSLHLDDKDGDLGYIPNYISIVDGVMERDFSYPEDVLPAIEGILRTLDTKTRIPFHAGLPTKYFVKMLLWQPLTNDGPRLLQPPLTTVPSWSWAAWTLGGVKWHEPDLRSSGQLVEGTTMKFLCSHDDDDHGGSRSPTKRSSMSGDLMPSQDTLFDCRVKVRNAKVKDFYIGRRSKPLADGDDENAIADYELVDASNRCLGEVRIAGHVARSKERFRCWAISTAQSLQWANPDEYHVPTYQRIVYEHKTTGEKSSFRPSDRDADDWTTKQKTEPQHRSQWEIVNVMLVHIRKGHATRIAIGKVMKNAWGKHWWGGELEGETMDLTLV